MPAVWLSLKKSLQCRSETSDVFDPRVRKNGNLSSIVTKKTGGGGGGGGRSGCSRSISNLKDVIHGSRRYIEKPTTCSPRSIGSSEFLNPITHEVVFNDSTCEIKITGLGGPFQDTTTTTILGGGGGGGGTGGVGSTFMGIVRPGTPGPGGNHKPTSTLPRSTPRTRSFSRREGSRFSGGTPPPAPPSNPRPSIGKDSSLGSSTMTCHKCGEQFTKWEAVETHHLSKHAVTELVEGDSSRRIVEMICKTGCQKPENNIGQIDRILKVHNMQKTIAQFEDHRETVKIKASKLQKKHPRCLADGNELLRFHGTTVQCSLGMNGSSNLCTSNNCNVCQILRHGFGTKKEPKGGNGIGVFTTSTSGRALETVELIDDNFTKRKALIVCRVIAGRVHRPLENIQELAGQTGFDSLAGKMGLYSNIEELFLLSPRALLPCFVVIYKP